MSTNYKATANVDDFFEQQDSMALDTNSLPRDEPVLQPDPDEEEKDTPTQTTNTSEPQQKDQKTEEPEQKNNPLQEVGTAVVGAGIDFVESIGETAQRTVQGKWLDWDWKPTWLQVDDAVEPMNTTIWGNILRGGLELGIGFVATGGAASVASAGLKATKVAKGVSAGLSLASKATKGVKGGKTVVKGVTAAGKLAQKPVVKGAAKGAVYDFVSSQNNEASLHEQAMEAFPWLPDVASYDDDDSPLERRLKNVMEGLALGAAIDAIFAFRAGKKAAKRIESGADSADPKAVQAGKSAEIQAEQVDAVQQSVQLEMELDPGMTQPHPSIHSGVFDAPAQGNRTAPQRSAYKAMKDMLAMASRGDLAAGRRTNLMPQAQLDRIAKTGEVRKHLDDLNKLISDGFELPAGQNVGGMATDMIGVRNLALSKYFDIVSTFPDLKNADFEDISEMLLEDAIQTTDVTGDTQLFMNPSNAIAFEMLMADAGQAVSDLSTALASVGTNVPMDMKVATDRLMNNLETMYLFSAESSEFAGSLLRARRGDVATPAVRQAARDKKQEIAGFMKELRKVIKTDPQAGSAFMRAFAESNGDVATLEALRRYAKDSVFNWGSVVGAKKSAFIDEMFTTLYNSILSSAKTLARAFSGTNLLTVLRPAQIAFGGALTGDMKTMQKGIAMGNSLFSSIGEAWELSKNTRQALIKNTPGPYAPQIRSTADMNHWKALGAIIEQGDDVGAKASYRMTTVLQDFNMHALVAYPRHTMSQIDAFSKTIIGRQELRSQAFDKVLETSDEVTAEALEAAEKELRDTIFNNQGEVIDVTAIRAGQEVALQTPLTGRLKSLNQTLNSIPILRPFFLFMKTGVNALEVVQKHTPLLARFNDEVNAILSATPENLSGVMEYGIKDVAQLRTAKALVKGRVSMGMMTVGSAVGLYTTGRLSGNGPADPETRRAWIANGWKPRSIKFGDKWINYDGLEPFASFLALTADIGDNSTNLGETGTENMLQKVGYMLSMNLTNKSYLAGINDLNEMLSFNGDRAAVWAGNLTNNFIPWAAARNDLANLMNPGMRELENDFLGSMMNRNPLFRGALPLKYDPLDGSVVGDWDFPTRMLNTISPFQISGVDTPTRKLLRDSGFDLQNTFKTDSLGNPLTPEQSSELQRLMGQFNIEKDLEKLFKNPKIKKDIEFYRKLRSEGVPGRTKEDPNNTPFEQSLTYKLMSKIFNDAKKRAMQSLYQKYPELRQQSNQRRARNNAQNSGQTDLVNLLIPTR